ncbi:hypothetical protein QJS10_CPA05g00299 [Acorus calamus]|uniref:Uncharacterized protein n=1 Tax=Acorus calamus TaxID=4465 RepID=A0AAV9EXV2_ACOCL|nr:hypothetical protein QJS10_CPA05g00299 [Acorus calamus]
MEADSWTSGRFSSSSSSRRYQASLQSRFDLYLGLDEIDGSGDEDSRTEYACPFCSEDFDIVGLCCHVDEDHPVEAKNGVCPVCMARVGLDLVGHIVVQHGSFFKLQRRRRFRKGSMGSQSALSLLKKELREGRLSIDGSSYLTPPSNSAPDPLLSSFIYNFPASEAPKDVQSTPLDDSIPVDKSSDEKSVESVEPCLSDKDQKEKAQRCAFVRGLVLSTIFEDNL